nr:immunoglobulin light chain junction region [Macaca mulatta]
DYYCQSADGNYPLF